MADATWTQRRRRLALEFGDLGLLVAWWFVVASFIAFFDFVSYRAANLSFFASIGDHLWYAALCNGLIGMLYAERHRLIWCLLSIGGGLIALCVMVFAVAMLNRFLAV